MLLTELNALFIHIPKTGGNSVQNALAPFAEDRKVIRNPLQDGIERFELQHDSLPTKKHSTLSEYKSCLDEELFENLFKFTVVRSTYERVMSFYFSPHRGSVEWDRGEFRRFVRNVRPIWHFIGYPEQSMSDAAGNMDCVLRFDSLSQDFESLARRLGISGTLGHYNRSSRSDSLRYYDDELIEEVRERFRAEIDYFGFQSPINLSR